MELTNAQKESCAMTQTRASNAGFPRIMRFVAIYSRLGAAANSNVLDQGGTKAKVDKEVSEAPRRRKTKQALKELRTDATDKVIKPAQNKRRATRKTATKSAPKTYIVERIVGKKKIKGRVHYLVKWKGYSDKDNTYEPASRLVEDGFKPEIDAFNRRKR